MAYGVQVFNAQGLQTVGIDNPTVVIDKVEKPSNLRVYDEAIVNGFSITFWEGFTKTYTQRQGATRLVTVAYFDALVGGSWYTAPDLLGWLILEVG